MITQRFTPPFALSDVDAVALNYVHVLGSDETLTTCDVTVDGGFTVDLCQIGTIDADNNFTAGAGTYIRAMLTATEVGNWEVTFVVETSGGRTLNRTERLSVVEARS